MRFGFVLNFNDRAGQEVELHHQPDAGSGIYLPNVKTFVYTTPQSKPRGIAHEARRRRCLEIMTVYGFTDWRFFYGTSSSPYWVGIPKDHARLLRENEPPLLILEDDIEPRAFCANVTPPAGAEVVYLGGGRGGDMGGINAARHAGLPLKRTYGYGYELIDADWMRVYGMLYSHAILWLDKRVMLEAAQLLDSQRRPIDGTIASAQWRWQTACRIVPMFWQRDGHHRGETFDYAPIPDWAKRKILVPCRKRA